mmetsp:Transcript_9755/g.12030  ORF Transcript_9755/g.12030 Transcript_9755/m.12030 type:complete len:141 (-) Transcript_9755:2358-2780(-)
MRRGAFMKTPRDKPKDVNSLKQLFEAQAPEPKQQVKQPAKAPLLQPKVPKAVFQPKKPQIRPPPVFNGPKEQQKEAAIAGQATDIERMLNEGRQPQQSIRKQATKKMRMRVSMKKKGALVDQISLQILMDNANKSAEHSE